MQLLLVCLFTAAAWALPPQRRSLTSDQQLALNVVMAIEYLESGFYTVACQRFGADNFTAADYPSSAYDEVCALATNKSAAIQSIGDVLNLNGAAPTGPCLYTFPTGDVSSFLIEAYTISSAAVGACLEGLSIFTASSTPIPSALTDLCTALITQSSFLRSTGGACPLDSEALSAQALPLSWAYNLAADWIASCGSPPLLPLLPFFRWTAPNPLPSLKPAIPPGSLLSFEWEPENFLVNVSSAAPLYVALAKGGENVTATFVGVEVSRHDPYGNYFGTVVVPEGVEGTVFAALTTFAAGLTMGELADYGTLAGPVVVMIS